MTGGQPEDELLAAIRVLVRQPIGTIEAGPLHPKVRQALGTLAQTALLSAETMAMQAISHPDLSPDDYLLIPMRWSGRR